MNEDLLDNRNLFVGCIIRESKRISENEHSRGRGLNYNKEEGRRSSSFCLTDNKSSFFLKSKTFAFDSLGTFDQNTSYQYQHVFTT